MKKIQEILEYKIFSINDYQLFVHDLVGVFVIILLVFIISRLIRSLLSHSKYLDDGSKYALGKISFYILIALAFFFSTKTLGIDISPLLVGSSVILVGIGLGLQNLFLDFISGIIILFDRSVRVGDVLDAEGVMGRVIKVNIRTTKLLTTDNKVIVVPNSILTKNIITNYTATDSGSDNSFFIEVGVAYDSNIELVQKLLVEAAMEHTPKNPEKPPIARLINFGDSALLMRLIFYTENTFGIGKLQSDIRISILHKFRENNINIPFPITTIDYPQNKGNKT